MDTKAKDGACLKYWRDRKKLTLRDLAGRTGIPKSKLSRIENAQQNLLAADLVKLVEVFGIPVGTFYRAAEAAAS